MESQPQGKEGTALCQACGLCCDGTLFRIVPVTEAEAAALSSLGLGCQTAQDGRPGLRQPCAALCERGCAVYAQRPSPCRAFRCHQLIALEEGEVSLPGALEVIAEAKRLRQAEPERLRPYLARHFTGRQGR